MCQKSAWVLGVLLLVGCGFGPDEPIREVPIQVVMITSDAPPVYGRATGDEQDPLTLKRGDRMVISRRSGDRYYGSAAGRHVWVRVSDVVAVDSAEALAIALEQRLEGKAGT